jgi:hypothetical protein
MCPGGTQAQRPTRPRWASLGYRAGPRLGYALVKCMLWRHWASSQRQGCDSNRSAGSLAALIHNTDRTQPALAMLRPRTA